MLPKLCHFKKSYLIYLSTHSYYHLLCTLYLHHNQSDVEEILERIKSQPGVEG